MLIRKIDSGLLGRIKEYVKDYCGNCGYGPSVREIASAHDIAVGTAQKYLAILLQDGQLSRGKRGYQSTDCASAVTDTMRVPILGTIPCGPLAEEEEYIQATSYTGSSGQADAVRKTPLPVDTSIRPTF